MKKSLDLRKAELVDIEQLLNTRKSILNGQNPAYIGMSVAQKRGTMQMQHTSCMATFNNLCMGILMARHIDCTQPSNIELYKEVVMEYIKKIPSERLSTEIGRDGGCSTSHTLIMGVNGDPKNLENLVVLAGFHVSNWNQAFKFVRDNMTLVCESSIEILHGSDNSVVLHTWITSSR